MNHIKPPVASNKRKNMDKCLPKERICSYILIPFCSFQSINPCYTKIFSLTAIERDCVFQFNRRSSRMRSFFFLGLTISLTLLSLTDVSPLLLSLSHTQSLSLLSSPLQMISLTPVLSLPPSLSSTVSSPMIRLQCCSGLSCQWAPFLPSQLG